VNRNSLTVPACATLGLLVPLAILDRRMIAAGSSGIIRFELAGPDRGAEILRAWGVEGRRAATASLLLDFPFLVAYTTLSVRLTQRAGNLLSTTGARALADAAPMVMAVQVGAGVCDAFENTALLVVVARGGNRRMAELARRAARMKFAGLAAGWMYDAAGAWLWLGEGLRLRRGARRSGSGLLSRAPGLFAHWHVVRSYA